MRTKSKSGIEQAMVRTDDLVRLHGLARCSQRDNETSACSYPAVAASSMRIPPVPVADGSVKDVGGNPISTARLLPEGDYPFATMRFPLEEMVMIEATIRLEGLFQRTADQTGIAIVRDEVVELRCISDDYPDATFVIWWPSGSERMHVLVPKAMASSLA